MSLIGLIAFLVSAVAAQADEARFDVSLGGRELGRLAWRSEGPQLGITAVFDNTPFGLADGKFTASSRPVRSAGKVVRQYVGTSDFTRKDRTISVLHAEGRALETKITPRDEETELSVVSAVPEGVVDPVEALSTLIRARSCPGRLRYYDGRRVIDIATARSAATATTFTCQGSYRVVAGPGHLSPLGITSVALTLTYATKGDQVQLGRIEMRTGMFQLTLSR